jgi:hypothetical protein
MKSFWMLQCHIASISFGQRWDDWIFSFQEWVHENYAGMKPEDFTAMQDFIAGCSSKPAKPTFTL